MNKNKIVIPKKRIIAFFCMLVALLVVIFSLFIIWSYVIPDCSCGVLRREMNSTIHRVSIYENIADILFFIGFGLFVSIPILLASIGVSVFIQCLRNKQVKGE